MKSHAKVLGPRQVRVFKQLGPLLAQNAFYLAGGTAVALQLGHRRSADFDWFTTKDLDEPLRLAEQLRGEGILIETEHIAPDTLLGTISGVRVSFFAYRYPLLQPTWIMVK